MMIEMGKHAVPVLSAWGVSLLLLVAITVQSLVAGARARRELEQVEQRRG